MSEECFICSTNNRVCKEKRGRRLGEKAQKSLVKAAETPKGGLITATLSTVSSVWVSDVCYKRNTDPRNVNKTVSVGDECAGDQPFSHLRDVVDLFHLVTERSAWYAKVSLILILLRKNQM